MNISEQIVESTSGIFGKLPGHGDFVQRNLPSSFITPWDEWLQRAVHGSKELIGEKWLDYYLTSPIWRFSLSPGVLNSQTWAGILVPSVDSVGRYFPITIAVPLRNGENPFSIQVEAETWFARLSEIAIDALQNTLLADTLLEKFPNFPMGEEPRIVLDQESDVFVVSGESGISQHYPSLIERLYKMQAKSFSLWWCSGSQHLQSTSILCPGLPDPSMYCAMLGVPKQNF